MREPAPSRTLRLLTINLRNPSEARARHQLGWLSGRAEDVLALTETRDSPGCRLLADGFAQAGYAVSGHRPPPGQYGAVIVSRLPLEADAWACRERYLRERVSAALVGLGDGRTLRIVAVYVPSRDAGPVKTERKRRFLAELGDELRACSDLPTVVIGDFNVLEPDHRPRYRFFRPFEYDFYRLLGDAGLVDAYRLLHPRDDSYSWVGRTGDGYRYDHAFVSRELAPCVLACAYEHEPRTGERRWTDHSALTLELEVPPAAGVGSRTASDPRGGGDRPADRVVSARTSTRSAAWAAALPAATDNRTAGPVRCRAGCTSSGPTP